MSAKTVQDAPAGSSGRLEAPGNEPVSAPEFVAASEPTKRLLAEAARIARFDVPVLIEGETGAGKELLARFVHRHSRRRDRPLVAVNSAALPESLLEAELFGHARGAFTDARTDRRGLLEAAGSGTLFLDEVGELSARGQTLLLRAIQEREFRRVGETRTRRSDFRLIAATQRPLAELAAAGAFRPDLLYRLQVIRLSLPPLRERPEEIPVLATTLLERLARRHRVARPGIDAGALERLISHDWPGNVRELESTLAAALLRRPGAAQLEARDFDRILVRPQQPGAGADPPQLARLLALRRLGVARLAFERLLVLRALERAAGNRARAARDLGLTRQGLARVLRRVRIG